MWVLFYVLKRNYRRLNSFMGEIMIFNRRLKPTARDKAKIMAVKLFNTLSIAVRLSERKGKG